MALYSAPTFDFNALPSISFYSAPTHWYPTTVLKCLRNCSVTAANPSHPYYAFCHQSFVGILGDFLEHLNHSVDYFYLTRSGTGVELSKRGSTAHQKSEV